MVTDNELMPKNDAELIEMERLMRTAPEPSVPQGVDMGAGVAVKKVSAVTAGHVTMWNTDTREPSDFNLNAVRTKLGEVFPPDYQGTHSMRGKPCWTAIDPKSPPFVGSVLCLLHPNRPERAEYDLLGYHTCDFAICANEAEAQRHLEKKHPDTNRMMEQKRGAQERDANTKNQDTMGKILAKLAGVDLAEVDPVITINEIILDEPSVTIVGSEPFTVVNSPTISAAEVNAEVFYCKKCEKNHRVGSGIARRHLKHK